MEPDLEVVQIRRGESFKAWSHGYPFHTVRWHFHPEYELHQVVATSGRYFVGAFQLLMRSPDASQDPSSAGLEARRAVVPDVAGNLVADDGHEIPRLLLPRAMWRLRENPRARAKCLAQVAVGTIDRRARGSRHRDGVREQFAPQRKYP